MSDFVITDKDEVVSLCCQSIKDSSLSGLYYQWVEGDVSEDDDVYCARIRGDPATHTVEQINAALRKVPREDVFFPLPIPWHMGRTVVTVADTWEAEPKPDLFLKRPFFPPGAEYNPDDEDGRSLMTPIWFTSEVRMLEALSRHPPHPNIVRYYGCRVRKGHVTGVLLGRVRGVNLWQHVEAGKTVDKEAFLAALASAVDHLHNVVGIAHNDIQPYNIMVSDDGTPTLIDLGSAEVIGASIGYGRPYGFFFLFFPSSFTFFWPRDEKGKS